MFQSTSFEVSACRGMSQRPSFGVSACGGKSQRPSSEVSGCGGMSQRPPFEVSGSGGKSQRPSFEVSGRGGMSQRPSSEVSGTGGGRESLWFVFLFISRFGSDFYRLNHLPVTMGMTDPGWVEGCGRVWGVRGDTGCCPPDTPDRERLLPTQAGSRSWH